LSIETGPPDDRKNRNGGL